jgi:hypothetical protein
MILYFLILGIKEAIMLGWNELLGDYGAIYFSRVLVFAKIMYFNGYRKKTHFVSGKQKPT